ncbi:hypothetical protein [uncultured Chryseobacterium sp.]|uniref:hypothetical protein n=1 Tax=uncultured Chryseobacterium sp. TaxID=259322 RepID=UPI0025FBF61F|nr:hypothetical protein [uncultured Chryseobacterium sp.]
MMITENIPLSHEHIDTGIVIPPVVFRIDSRSPYAETDYDGINHQGIFNEGFTAKGTNYKLTEHVLGGNNNSASNGASGYVATTSNPSSLINILSTITGNMLLHEVDTRNLSLNNSGRIAINAYVYNIRPTDSNFYSVVDNLPDGYRFDRYRGQDEWLAVDKIDREQIQSAIIYEDVFVNGIRQGSIRPVSTVNNNYYLENTPRHFAGHFNSADVGVTKINQQQPAAQIPQQQLTQLQQNQTPQTDHQPADQILQQPLTQPQHGQTPQIDYQLADQILQQQLTQLQQNQTPQIDHQPADQILQQPLTQLQHGQTPQINYELADQILQQQLMQLQQNQTPQTDHQPTAQIQEQPGQIQMDFSRFATPTIESTVPIIGLPVEAQQNQEQNNGQQLITKRF